MSPPRFGRIKRMYKDKEKQKKANKLRMQRVRITRRVTQKVTQTGEKTDVLPAYLVAIVDKRSKMEAIVEQLSRRRLLEDIRYGVNGPTFKEISEILEDTR